MDIASLVGIVLAFGAVLVSALIEHTDLSILIRQYAAFILVFFGTLGATMLSFPLRTFINGFKLGVQSVFFEKNFGERNMITQLVSFAEKARREGLLALENESNELEDPFLRKGIQLVIDGRDAEIIRRILETEVSLNQEHGAKAEQVFMNLGGYSPTLGIIGTVLGLINMLQGLAKATGEGNVAGSIGEATAAAFVATFFGILFANLLWLPMGTKIKERTAKTLLLREIQIEGILSIQAGDNPRLLEEKLTAFLEPEQRGAAAEGQGGGVGEPAGATA
ncbi:MAG TPA: MotA/TolQ/ExbB proton channel family protein [Candidatus Binatia bacterium]|nr:MotA/TolQ/ExbB proton channel family protein [Candidatus Binatia bacterium]